MVEPQFERLTESERGCLRLALSRNGSKDIAPLIGLTHHTVDKRFKSAMRKLGASTRFEAARIFAGYERQIAQKTVPDQSSDASDQPSDLAKWLETPMVALSSDGIGAAYSGRPGELREEQARYFPGLAGHPQLRLPLRRLGEVGNGLGAWQRAGWIAGIALLLVVAFGFLATGLTSLGRIATHVAHVTRNS